MSKKAQVLCQIANNIQTAERLEGVQHKVRENKARRKAERQGLQLQKSRRRDPHASDFGRFMLVDVATNTAVMGAAPNAYSASIDEVEAWLAR